jgi:hypothetical protein
MLVALASVKGSPGVSSTSLALAAVWPRPVALLEADPAGGDLSYRCRAAHGGAVSPHRGVLKLAAAVRDGGSTDGSLLEESQLLACGVSLVQGLSGAAQARGLANLWPRLARACVSADIDVLADLGRLERNSPTMPIAQAADHLLVLATASLDSVMHLSHGLQDIASGLGGPPSPRVAPVLVGPDAHATRDCAELDDVLRRAGLPVGPTRPITWDPRALHRLEQGERPTRLRRTLYLRAARAVAVECLGHTLGGPTNDSPTRGRGLGTQVHAVSSHREPA